MAHNYVCRTHFNFTSDLNFNFNFNLNLNLTSIAGVPDDAKESRTATINDNGFNPHWNEVISRISGVSDRTYPVDPACAVVYANV